MKDKDNSIETIRGLACIFLVLYHVVGENNHSGLNVSNDSVIRYLNDSLAYIRMPLFTFLSGYVYALRPFNVNMSWVKFIKGKSRRLLFPMLTVGTFFAIIQSVTPGANNGLHGHEWLTLHILPVAHYWYLESLFIIFIFIVLLEKIDAFKNLFRFFIVMMIFSIICSYCYLPKYFGLSGAAYLMPFFLFGMGSKRYKLYIDKKNTPIAFVLFIATFLVAQLSMLGVGVLNHISKTSIMAILMGCSFCFLLVKSKMYNTYLVKIGGYSYSVYLFHVFGTAASRILFKHMGITNVYVLIVLGLFFGVALPIMIECSISNMDKFSKTLLLGRRFEQ